MANPIQPSLATQEDYKAFVAASAAQILSQCQGLPVEMSLDVIVAALLLTSSVGRVPVNVIMELVMTCADEWLRKSPHSPVTADPAKVQAALRSMGAVQAKPEKRQIGFCAPVAKGNH